MDLGMCKHGCGNPATFVSKTGRRTCQKSAQSCPAIKAKNSAAHKDGSPWSRRPHPRGMLGKTPWNKGKTLATEPRMTKSIEGLRKARSEGKGWGSGSTHSPETLEWMRQNNGGYRQNTGQGRKGRYRGVWCDSSWELAFLIWCEIQNYQVIRNTERFEYVFDGVLRHYTPDFLCLGKDKVWKYVEVKGYESPQWEAKRKAFPHELVVINRPIMERYILPEVVEKYGSNFIREYDQS